MNRNTGIGQRQLRKFTCQWGKHVVRHAALLPFFHRDYKVLGVLGISPGEAPVWYPGVPVNVRPGKLLFKDTFSDLPPALQTLEPDLFEKAFYFDPWGLAPRIMAILHDAPSLEHATNLAGRRLMGRPLVDVIYEKPLHCVQAFELRGSWMRTEKRSILSLPGLREALDPLPQAAPGDTPGVQPEEVQRLLERKLRSLLNVPTEEEPLPQSPEKTPSKPVSQTGAKPAPQREEGLIARMVRRAIEAGLEDKSE